MLICKANGTCTRRRLHDRRTITRPPQMRTRPPEQTLPDVRLAQQQLDLLLGPVPGRQCLQEHHDLLEVHRDQLGGPADEEGGADVEVEARKALLFGLEFRSSAYE